ncbi:9384_t:CDS:1 [Acaulospora colombiana]|uniref:9384_t:CDS:1 n=1 Tax=Acaulospora colombiana TaxID=27376 RepID=A0ACA9LQ97_9GLOM|nr:9384_t:CDS:1 [Acaulospora colombiana]
MVGGWSSEVSTDAGIHEYMDHLFKSQPWLVRPSYAPEHWRCNTKMSIYESENSIEQCKKKADDTIMSYEETRGKDKRKNSEDLIIDNENGVRVVQKSSSEFDLYKRTKISSDNGYHRPSCDSHSPNGHLWGHTSLQNCKRSLSLDSQNFTRYSQSSSENLHYSSNEQLYSSSSSHKLSYHVKHGESLLNATKLNIFNFEQTIYNPHFNHLLWDQGLVDRLSDNGWFDDIVYSPITKPKSLLRQEVLWNARNFELLRQSTEDDSSLTVLFFPNNLAGSLNDIIKILKAKGITCDMKKVEMGSRSTKKDQSDHACNIENRKPKREKRVKRIKSNSSTISSTRTLYLLYPQDPDYDVRGFQSKSVQLFLKKFPTIEKVQVWEDRETHIMNFEKLFAKLRSERKLETELHRGKVHRQSFMNPIKEWNIVNFVVTNYNNKIDSIYKTLKGPSFSDDNVDEGINYEKISLFIKIQHSVIYFNEDVVEKLARLYSPPTSTIFEYDWEIKCPYVLIQSDPHLVALNKVHDYLEEYVTPCGRIDSVVLMHIVAKAVIQGRYYGFKVKAPSFDDYSCISNYRTLPVHFAEKDSGRQQPFILMMAYDRNMVEWSIESLPTVVYDEIVWEDISRDDQVILGGFVGVKFEICDDEEIPDYGIAN